MNSVGGVDNIVIYLSELCVWVYGEDMSFGWVL